MPSRGFTLIEIIVVVLVFSIMAVMAYGGLNTVLKTRSAVEASMERTAAMQKAFLRMRADFQNVRNRPARDGFGDEQPPLRAAKEGPLTLVRGGWRNPLLLPRSSMERVSYELDEKILKRASWRTLDQAQDVQPVVLPLLDNIEELRWRFLDDADQWQDIWPPQANVANTAQAAAQPPPKALEITLVTKDWGETRFLFRNGVDKMPASFGAPQVSSDKTPEKDDGGKDADPPATPTPPPDSVE
jgi:general secretion pathway protein J